MAAETTSTRGQAPGDRAGTAARLGVGADAVPSAAATEALRRRGAYFSLFSLPAPESPSTGIPLTPVTPQLFTGFQVSEGLHRFEVAELPDPGECGFRIEQRYGRADVARVAMRMTPAPNNYQPGPGRTPWPTVLLPFLSQRFVPLDGSFAFLDAAGSGFGAAGAGRVVPAGGGLRPMLAAVLEPESPTGRLAGLAGVGIVNGDIAPPAGFAFNVLFRFDDPDGRLGAAVPPEPLAAAADPTPEAPGEPGASFLPFLSEPAPGQPLRVGWSADRSHVEVHLVERLRQVALAFSVAPPGLRVELEVGPVVGTHRATLRLDPGAGGAVVPAFSRGDAFSFFDRAGRSLGGFVADTLEARVFLPAPGGGTALRIGGFARPRQGTGQFRRPSGMVSINGAFDPGSGAVSTLYMVRLSAPDAVFKAVARRPVAESRAAGRPSARPRRPAAPTGSIR